MDMQDKEFDNLFRSQLDGLEVQPSAAVWDKTAAKLPAKKQNKLVPLLSIAATVVMLLTAGLLFIPKKGRVEHNDVIKSNIAKTKPVPDTVAPQKNTPAVHLPIGAGPAVADQLALVKRTKATRKVIADPASNAARDNSSAKLDEQPQIAAVRPKQSTIVPVVPDVAIPLMDKQADEQPVVAASPTVLAADQQPNEAKKTAPAAKRHRINSLGGLLNVVIAAVDKRKDKVVEFSDSDDGEESNITAVNLGILKVKKDK